MSSQQKNMLSNFNSDTTSDNTPNNPTGVSQTSITLRTQTDKNPNIGQGLEPLNPFIVEKSFDEITLKKLANFLLNLHNVLEETFIAEAIKNDTNSNKICRPIELQDWTAIKDFSKYWFSFHRELSTNPNGFILYDGKFCIPTRLRKK